jgi:hypothetical protein
MKTIMAILVGIAATAAVAEDTFSPDPVPITNVVKSPIVMKGLYGTRSSRTNAPSLSGKTEAAVMKALRMFKARQNEDGSWGAEDKRRLATPLVLTALLGHGETASSHEFGDAVARAHRYLLACTPTNDAERITGIIALSEYVALHVGSTQRDAAKAEVAKIQASLSAVRRTADDPWVDYLTFYLLPQEVPRPAWLKYTHDFPKRWSEAKVNVEPVALDEYVALRVAGLAKFRIGGKVWSEFNHQFAPKMVERQTAEGFYPCQPEANQFACTSLAVQAMQVYYAYQPRYYAQPEPEQEQKPGSEEVEVKIE